MPECPMLDPEMYAGPADSKTTPTKEPVTVSASIIAVFGLRHLLDDARDIHPINPDAYSLNVPVLEVQAGPKGSPIVPLRPEAQQIIRERNRQIVNPTHESAHTPPTCREMHQFQKWLDCMAIGMNEADAASHIGASHRTVKRVSERMRELLGVTNQASIMYSALLHGYQPDIPAPEINRPELTINRSLHLFLAAIGFEAKEAAELTQQKVSEVKLLKINAAKKLGASAMTQAITHAFMTGHYQSLPSLGQ